MGKKINIDIKNKQLAEALNLGGLREKLAKRTGTKETEAEPVKQEKQDKDDTKKKAPAKKKAAEPKKEEVAPETHTEMHEVEGEAPRRVKARSTSAFAEGTEVKPKPVIETVEEEAPAPTPDIEEPTVSVETPIEAPLPKAAAPTTPAPVRLGPTGRHVDDLFKRPTPPAETKRPAPAAPRETPRNEPRQNPQTKSDLPLSHPQPRMTITAQNQAQKSKTSATLNLQKNKKMCAPLILATDKAFAK